MDIHQLLTEEGGAIVEEAARSAALLTNYQRDGDAVTRQRLEALFAEVASAIRRRDLCELLDHAERIARERFQEGYQLHEVQTAFYMLEHAIWRRALARLPPEEIAEALGLVGTAVRRGKEAFGRAWLSLASRARAPSLDLDAEFKDRQGEGE
jgi:hypothetical protein